MLRLAKASLDSLAIWSYGIRNALEAIYGRDAPDLGAFPSGNIDRCVANPGTELTAVQDRLETSQNLR